jgi:hypothetical protein
MSASFWILRRAGKKKLKVLDGTLGVTAVQKDECQTIVCPRSGSVPVENVPIGFGCLLHHPDASVTDRDLLKDDAVACRFFESETEGCERLVEVLVREEFEAFVVIVDALRIAAAKKLVPERHL